ncbi:hypothetical protein H8356DRAFT_1416196 [Neocallimastix lanati (nom. inval.)]|nr:hypothetical protein H8356DRAFT_1416196 [Neocallimastix sp. JGI-2020a]
MFYKDFLDNQRYDAKDGVWFIDTRQKKIDTIFIDTYSPNLIRVYLKKSEDIVKNRHHLKGVNYVLGQGINNDIKDFKKININLSKYKKMSETTVYEYGIIEAKDLYMSYKYLL